MLKALMQKRPVYMSKNSCSLILLFLLSNIICAQTSQWTVYWNKNTEPDLSHYVLYKSTSPGASTAVGTIYKPDTTYSDSDLEKGILYYYRLKAVDYSGNYSVYSDEDSAAIPLLNFSKLGDQVISPGGTMTINNLDDYVTDPDDDSFEWSASAPSLTINIDNATQTATIMAHSDFSNTVAAEFQVSDNDGFFDVATLNFKADSSIIIPENGKSTFAWPALLNLADDPTGTINFQNIPDGATIHIYNMMGELVYKLKEAPYEWDIKNDSGKAIYPGVYLYHIKAGNKKRTGKFVIVK